MRPRLIDIPDLSRAKCTVSADDVVILVDADGAELFRKHQPGSYELFRSAGQGVSIGFRDGKVDCVTAVTPRSA